MYLLLILLLLLLLLLRFILFLRSEFKSRGKRMNKEHGIFGKNGAD